MVEKNITRWYVFIIICQIPGGMNFATANTNGMANTQVDGIERYCGRVFVANAAASGVAATRSVCSKYFVKTRYVSIIIEEKIFCCITSPALGNLYWDLRMCAALKKTQSYSKKNRKNIISCLTSKTWRNCPQNLLIIGPQLFLFLARLPKQPRNRNPVPPKAP